MSIKCLSCLRSFQNKQSHIMVIMDCVYFRRVCVYLVIRDWYLKKNIYFKRIPYETIDDYVLAIDFLEVRGFIIDGIVVDGRKGVFEALSDKYPVQMCQFHQKQIVRRYLTNKPKTEASQMFLSFFWTSGTRDTNLS